MASVITKVNHKLLVKGNGVPWNPPLAVRSQQLQFNKFLTYKGFLSRITFFLLFP